MALKRKIETESKNGPTASKVKVKVVETKKKPLTKNELMLKYNALEEKHDNLVKEHSKNIELIHNFEGKIQNLECQVDYSSCREIMICKKT